MDKPLKPPYNPLESLQIAEQIAYLCQQIGDGATLRFYQTSVLPFLRRRAHDFLETLPMEDR